jgi:hypothetical protein
LGLQLANPAFAVRAVHLHAEEARRYAEVVAPRVVRGALQLLPLSLEVPLWWEEPPGEDPLPAPMRY